MEKLVLFNPIWGDKCEKVILNVPKTHLTIHLHNKYKEMGDTSRGNENVKDVSLTNQTAAEVWLKKYPPSDRRNTRCRTDRLWMFLLLKCSASLSLSSPRSSVQSGSDPHPGWPHSHSLPPTPS